MKKYFYISILLGAFALSGCADDEVDNKEMTEESSLTKQSKANNTEVNAAKTKEAAPIPLNFTQEQKEDYYQKYIAVIRDLNEEHNAELKLEPINTFSDDAWVEVDTFKKRAKERIDVTIAVLKNKERYHPASVPKTVILKMGSKKENIVFEGSFDTQLNENTPKGRQLFSVFNGVSSEAEGSNVKWNQYGNVVLLKDNGATYLIEVSGNYSQYGIISTHTIPLEFDCDKNGGIS